MKEIKLQRLSLQNFKGFTFDLEANGQDVDVSGANATGKTTLADAASWLLFDKDSLGRSDFEIKNLDATGEAEHGLDHTVEGVFYVGGDTITLKKVYHEIWSKKRGSAQSTFTGNTVDHYINGVPAKANEYKSFVSETVTNENIFRLLTSPTVFPGLPWKEQRSLLLEVCGDVSDADVIATDSSLSPLIDLLKKYTVSKTPLDDLRKVVTSGRTEINKKIDQLPVRIDEVIKGMPDIKGLDRAELEAEVQSCEHFLNEAKLRLSGIDNGSNITELSKKLAGINADIQALETAYTNDAMKAVNRLNQQIREVAEAKDAHERKSKSLSDSIAFSKKALPGIEEKLSRLREKWNAIDAESFTDSVNDTCPTCGQALPSERVQDARDKALAAFNQSKAERLTDIEKEGTALAGEKDRIIKEIEAVQKELIELPAFESAHSIVDLEAQRDTLKTLAENYTGIAGHADLLAQKTAIEIAINDAKESVSFDKDGINAEIADLQTKLIDAKAKADIFPRREQGEKRVQELKAEEKKLAKEFEELEKQLFLIESFTKRKVSMLTDRINSKFEIARFKLFEIQVNGGLNDCCEITVNGVGFNSNLNNAARINAGLDVCRTLSNHYGLLAPIFVDNAESVCELLNMDAQLIRLIVSEKDTRLRIEMAQKARQAA